MSNQTPKQGDDKFVKSPREEEQKGKSSRSDEKSDPKRDREQKEEEDKKSDSRRSK